MGNMKSRAEMSKDQRMLIDTITEALDTAITHILLVEDPATFDWLLLTHANKDDSEVSVISNMRGVGKAKRMLEEATKNVKIKMENQT